ncbi:MAG TPA: MnmC family methyltransferase [Candidatus Nanoarchaeia archaeon]|nr:methyltransferase domain-containing protein [Candidatus Woesearchaeota archaeon]HIH12567.1 methyltransferase domain-containing protein [Candidatus Woesearchaeota archaeon]HLC70714.1 MnmC family methyltransferase [Candidatus Nanoarchaeia archaeon]
MQKILTADRSETYLNEEVGECYHSLKGAAEEATQKYVIPCKIKELAKTGKIRILDVCFGLGYNSAMAISIALEENHQCEIEVIGLEYDPEIINKIQEVSPPITFFSHYKKLTPTNLEFQHGKVKVKVLLGDANETAKQLTENHFDAIFFDPFSPKTAPEMWQVHLFQEMWRVMKSTGILATYSCARMARDNMAAAGLMYDDGPIWGRRGPGTIATKWTSIF